MLEYVVIGLAVWNLILTAIVVSTSFRVNTLEYVADNREE